MIEEKRENRGEQPEEQVNIQEILFRYLIHWQIGRASCRERV